MFASLGNDCVVEEGVEIGVRYSEDCEEAVIGDNAVIRSGSIIYADVEAGDNLMTGHSVLVREDTLLGDDVVVGTNVVIEGHVEIRSSVKLETGAYIPTHTEVGDGVFVGPYAVLTNDKYPQRLRDEYEPKGPILGESVTVGANATVLPDVEIGEGSMVAAGSVVTEDVPPWSLVVGVPGRIEPLPEKLKHRNRTE